MALQQMLTKIILQVLSINSKLSSDNYYCLQQNDYMCSSLIQFHRSTAYRYICNTQLDTSVLGMSKGAGSSLPCVGSIPASVVFLQQWRVHLHVCLQEEQYPPPPMPFWMHEAAQFLLLMHGPWKNLFLIVHTCTASAPTHMIIDCQVFG